MDCPYVTYGIDYFAFFELYIYAVTMSSMEKLSFSLTISL